LPALHLTAAIFHLVSAVYDVMAYGSTGSLFEIVRLRIVRACFAEKESDNRLATTPSVETLVLEFWKGREAVIWDNGELHASKQTLSMIPVERLERRPFKEDPTIS